MVGLAVAKCSSMQPCYVMPEPTVEKLRLVQLCQLSSLYPAVSQTECLR